MNANKPPVLADTDWYKALREYFNEHKLNGEVILASAGLSGQSEYNQHVKFYSDAVARAFREMGRLTRDPACGLQHFHPLGQLGVLSHVMQAAATVKLAVLQASRYLHLYWPMAKIELSPATDKAVLLLKLASGKEDIPGELYDFFIMCVVNAFKMVSAAQPQILEVSRPGPKPADPTPWTQAFGCPVNFASAECSISFDPAYLNRNLPTANSTLFNFSVKLLEQTAEQRGYSIKSQIRAVLPAHLARGSVRRETIASMLDMSERTLCRRIASEGTTFSNLVDELRRDLAESYMHQGYSPTEIAYAIGFSDPSNFYRACRRWFGKTPAHLDLKMGPSAFGSTSLDDPATNG